MFPISGRKCEERAGNKAQVETRLMVQEALRTRAQVPRRDDIF
jgi:hypothetical protein